MQNECTLVVLQRGQVGMLGVGKVRKTAPVFLASHLTLLFYFQGQDCAVPIHACISNPCKHGGSCHLKDVEKDGFW